MLNAEPEAGLDHDPEVTREPKPGVIHLTDGATQALQCVWILLATFKRVCNGFILKRQHL